MHGMRKEESPIFCSSSLFYDYLHTSPFSLSVFISPSFSLFLHLQFWHLYSTCNDHNCNTTHILFAITLLPFLPLKSLREKGIFLTPTCSNSKNIWFCFYIWKVKPSWEIRCIVCCSLLRIRNRKVKKKKSKRKKRIKCKKSCYTVEHKTREKSKQILTIQNVTIRICGTDQKTILFVFNIVTWYQILD